MDAKTQFQTRFQRLSLARRLLIGALLWSVLLVVGGVVAISAVYRAEAVNILDDEHSGTIQTSFEPFAHWTMEPDESRISRIVTP